MVCLWALTLVRSSFFLKYPTYVYTVHKQVKQCIKVFWCILYRNSNFKKDKQRIHSQVRNTIISKQNQDLIAWNYFNRFCNFFVTHTRFQSSVLLKMMINKWNTYILFANNFFGLFCKIKTIILLLKRINISEQAYFLQNVKVHCWIHYRIKKSIPYLKQRMVMMLVIMIMAIAVIVIVIINTSN
jgi:hypothetical protein